MPAVENGVYTITFTIRDDKGALSGFRLNCKRLVPDTFAGSMTVEPANMVEYYAYIMSEILDNIIDGVIESVTISTTVNFHSFPWLSAPTTPFKTVAEPTADVEEAMVFKWRTENGHFTHQRIPTIKEHLITIDGKLIALADDEWLLRWYEMIYFPEDVEWGADWFISPCDARGEHITSLADAYEAFRRSAKED